MFSALQSGSPIFVLEKNTLILKIGQVQSKGAFKPTFGQMYNTAFDMVVNANGENIAIPNVPSNLSVATIDGLIISETREGMAAEVENLQRMTQQVIDNYEAHKQTVVRCSELLKELNPQLAQEQAQREKIASLEASIDELKAMLSKALTKNKKQDENNN